MHFMEIEEVSAIIEKWRDNEAATDEECGRQISAIVNKSRTPAAQPGMKKPCKHEYRCINAGLIDYIKWCEKCGCLKVFVDGMTKEQVYTTRAAS